MNSVFFNIVFIVTLLYIIMNNKKFLKIILMIEALNVYIMYMMMNLTLHMSASFFIMMFMTSMLSGSALAVSLIIFMSVSWDSSMSFVNKTV